jgi:putative aminopeptidase FrvX
MHDIDEGFLEKFLVDLLNIPSPTGYTEGAIEFCEKTLSAISGITLLRTHKGALLASLLGTNKGHEKALTAHIDTLGAMVKAIKPSGRLQLTQIGGYAWNSVEGEGCTVFSSSSGKSFRGSILINKASVHVHGRQVDLKREDEVMEIRLDETVHNAEEVEKLGISVGDYVTIDPRVEVVNGFIRSRHLDDKAGVACLVSAIKTLHDNNQRPVRNTHFLISNFEEVGHGAAAGIPPEVEELLVVDMAAVGEGQTSDEFHTTICVKDSNGPYHHEFSQRLRKLADRSEIPYKVDIYPHYGSDGGAFLNAGGNVAVALIGPGVDASHHYERTHIDALKATTAWVQVYLLEESS